MTARGRRIATSVAMIVIVAAAALIVTFVDPDRPTSSSLATTSVQGDPDRRDLSELGSDTTVIAPAADSNAALAVALSQATFPPGASVNAVLARDDVGADALSSAGLQGALRAPLLLTGSDSLSLPVTAELQRLGVQTVYLLGGPSAIAPIVAQRLQQLGYGVERVSGRTRIDTAIAIAEQYLPDADTAVLVGSAASGGSPDAFVDALAAGGWAAAEQHAVLFTDPAGLSAESARYLDASDVADVIVVGGPTAVGNAVLTSLEERGLAIQRVSGATRYGTAVQIAEQREIADSERVLLVSGVGEDLWAAGFASASYSSRAGAPIVLSDGDSLPPETEEFLDGLPPRVQLVCAPRVTEEVCARAQQRESGS